MEEKSAATNHNETFGDRTYKLRSGITSEYGRYVKSLVEPVTGPGLFIEAHIPCWVEILGVQCSKLDL